MIVIDGHVVELQTDMQKIKDDIENIAELEQLRDEFDTFKSDTT
jgi:hypothetical protein